MKEIICQKLNCSENEAEEIVRDLECIGPQFQDLLYCWLNDKPYHDIEICSFTIKSLMDDYGLGFTGALMTLDWIDKNRDEAVKALKFGIR